MTKTIQGDLMPPATIQCDCCNTTLQFGVGECPNCLSRIAYPQNTPRTVMDQCACYFAFPFAMPLWFPEIGQRIGWPATITACLILGGILAKWAFNRNWPKRYAFKSPRFYRRTYHGYSTRTTSEERAEAAKPYLMLMLLPYAFACIFVSGYTNNLVLKLLGADTDQLWSLDKPFSWIFNPNLDPRTVFIPAIAIAVGGLFYANHRGWLDRLKNLEKQFFA